MYFVIGWPQTLSSSENIHLIVPNSDQSLFLFLSQDAISLWYCRPVVQIVQYKRTSKSLQEYGQNVSAIWKSDSSQIVVQTSSDFLLFYQVVISEDNDTILQLIEPKRGSIPNDSNSDENNKIPALILELQRNLFIEDGITCFMSAEEEIVISTKDGNLCGIEWDGQFDENFHLNISIPPIYHQKKEEPAQPCFVRDFKYSTIIGGFSLVFSNGLGAFLPLNSNVSNYSQLQLITHVDNALCTAINHKYALIAFGLNSSVGVLCGFDEIDRRFIVSHRLSLPSNTYPEVDKFLGPMTSLQWTPDSSVIATAWKNGGFALWTVFGSLLTCSLSWNYSFDIDNKMQVGPYRVSSLAFGKEGFHLWMATKPSNIFSDEVNNDSQNEKLHFNWVCKLSLAKSVLACNPCSSVSVETVLLASEDRIFVGGNKSSSLFAQLPEDTENGIANKKLPNGTNDKLQSSPSIGFLYEQESNAVDSFQWITVPLPQSYLDSNWPIRFFAIDPHTSQNLAITGLNGLAIYSLIHRRWKLFGNENHERDFVVTGGFIWFYDYIIAGCYNLVQDCYEIRAYSHRNKLDNSNAKILAIDKEVYLLSLHRNRLLALCSNGSILLFDLHLFKRTYQNGSESTTELNISSPIRVIVNNLEIFPDCVTVCLLTDLHVNMYHSAFQSESSHRSLQIQTSAVARSHSILINLCGRVLLLEMDIDTTGLPLSSDDDEDSDSIKHNSAELTLPKKVNGDYEQSQSNTNTIKYRKVVNLASNVENLWILPHDEAQLNAFRPTLAYSNRNQQLRPHLVTSLYLSCGAQGMAVWLSLEHSIRPQYSKVAKKDYLPSDNEHAYISKRIMLSISEIAFTIYPLAIRFREAIVLGAESDFTHPNSFYFSNRNQLSEKDDSLFIPFCLVKRTSQVYLHYVLRELLRRNLGYRAWEIANTCTTLPHFVHSLELLLHGVLEEEAASSQPIPDALLPRVVDFIRAFPVFLQTVIHCARKTELALWPHLFNVVGSPKDLFQQCLLEGQLETASSYIIVLQNLEKSEVATKCASRLLQAARIAGSWVTVKELKRFLRATNYAEESENSSTTGQSMDNNIDLSNTNDRFKQETKEPSQTNSPSPNVGPVINGQMIPLIRSNSVDQTSAKLTSSPASHNHIIYPHLSRTIPGAAIKQNDPETDRDSPLQEANIVMKETDESSKDDDSLLSNSEDQIEPVEELKVNALKYNGHNSQRNGRAYPGTILRMNHDSHPNSPFHFLTTSPFAKVTSSTSSISSFSSASSSAISSASVSPTVHKSRLTASVESSSTITSEGPKMLKVVPINPDETNQCVIS